MLTQHRVTNGSIVSSLIDLMQNFWVDIDEKRHTQLSEYINFHLKYVRESVVVAV